MEIAQLNKKISQKEFDNAYFFFGDEEYLKDFYIQKIIKSTVPDGTEAFNLSEYKTSVTHEELSDTVEQPPVMGDYKVVYLNELNIFKNDAKFRDTLTEILDDIPDFCILIIRETNTDSKTKLGKKLQTSACCVKCEYPSDSDMRAFVVREFKKRGKSIAPNLAEYFVLNSEKKMHTVMNTIEETTAYLYDVNEVSKKALDNFLVQSMETVVYNLSDFIVTKDFEKAYGLLNKLKLTQTKNPPQSLFSLISRHILGLYITFLAQKSGIGDNETAMLIGPRTQSFVVKKYQKQLRNIDAEKLAQIVNFCAENDYKLKNGLVSDPYLPIYELFALFS